MMSLDLLTSRYAVDIQMRYLPVTSKCESGIPERD